jgi:branched-chain amino acid aminotransferase
MSRTNWLPQVAVSQYSEATSDYGPPVASSNAIGSQAQISADAVQFGFSVFEGMRAYVADGKYLVFRSKDHHERLTRSCCALDLPCPGYETFITAIRLVVERNYDAGVPCLYVRPLVFATGGGIMAQQDRACTFAVLCTPFAVHNGDIKVLVDTQNLRTVPAFSTVKTATNYASSSLITGRAQKDGYDTVLWLDGSGFVQECSTTNVFFFIGGQLCTPGLDGILPGVTRRTVMELVRAQGGSVLERDIHIDEVVDGVKSGDLSYFFTTSTALGINRVTHLKHLGTEYRIEGECPSGITAARESYASITRGFPGAMATHSVLRDRSYIGDVPGAHGGSER